MKALFKLAPLLVAVAGGVPAVLLKLGVLGLRQPWDTAVYAAGIASGAFVVSWAVEVLRMEIGGALAIAVLALVTVAPEYSVEAVFAWKAGHDPEHYASLALANMTGSNRLLIGLGWPVIAFVAWAAQRTKRRREGAQRRQARKVVLSAQRSAEVAFLGLASLYTLSLPLRSRLSLADALVLGALYVLYILRIRKMGGEDAELVGPAEVIGGIKPWLRRTVLALLFAFSGAVLISSAEPFAEGVVEAGQKLGLSRFLAVRWLAPLASEMPELILSVLLAWRLEAATALAALISTKLNQWTLLIGSIPVLFAISQGGLAGLPIDTVQREALFITAAQSLYALSLLVDRDLSVTDAGLLLFLFGVDFVTSTFLPDPLRSWGRIALGAVYLALAAGVLIHRRREASRTVTDGLLEQPGEQEA